jgi:hypothetical protein
MTPPSDQLPAIIEPGALATLPDTHLVPALVAAAGEQAGCRYVQFFTVNILNPHTRQAYARACGRLFAWCEDRGLTLTLIRPFDVGTYMETLGIFAPIGNHSIRATGTTAYLSNGSTHRRWPRARAHGQRNSMIVQRNGLRRTR